MPLYIYKAKNLRGEIVKGKLEAIEKDIVISMLKNRGLFPIDVDEAKDTRRFKFNVMKKVKLTEMYIFCKQFSTMINAGVTIISALEILARQAENPTLKMAIRRVSENVHKGFSLSESMRQYGGIFPPILTNMIEMGELSGKLDEVLEQVAEHFEKENRIYSKVKTALVYPMFILGVAILAVIFMIVFVLPKFIAMFDAIGGELPAITRILMSVADKFTQPLFLIGLAFVIALIVSVIGKFKDSEKGKEMIDKMIFRIPVFKTEYKKIVSARFTRTLSLLLGAGVPLIQTFDVVANVLNNRIVTRGIENVKNEIRSGSNIASPLALLGIFPSMVIQMISVGEETGTMETTIGKVADYYDEEVDRAITKLTSIIEPILILMIAVIVGIVVVAMIMPLFSLEEQLGTLL